MRPHGKCQQTSTTTMTTELDPQEFFLDVALLISESRLPDKNAGRGEGPHCPDVGGRNFPPPSTNSTTKSSSSSPPVQTTFSTSVQSSHVCDFNNVSCRQARQIVDEANNLWSRNIPACLFVFLLPDQCSNAAECLSDDAVLLERWTIQVLPKRNTDNKLLPGQFLLQAVRSYLHFSQLSAWLIESRGKSPTNVTYRIRMPGESVDSKNLLNNAANSSSSSSSALTTPTIEKHQFPSCLLGKSLILNVSVESLARPFNLLTLHCRCLKNNGSAPSSSSSSITTEEEGEKNNDNNEQQQCGGNETTILNNQNLNNNNNNIVLLSPTDEIKDRITTTVGPVATNCCSFVETFNKNEQCNKEDESDKSFNEENSSDKVTIDVNNDSYSSPLTPATSSTDIEDDLVLPSSSSSKINVERTKLAPISLPTVNYVSSSSSSDTAANEVYQRRSNDKTNTLSLSTYSNCSVANPLFDVSQSQCGQEASLKQRIDALRLEAQQLTTKWRRYADYSMKNYQKPSPEVRFYVADDDEDDDSNNLLYKNNFPTTSSSNSADFRRCSSSNVQNNSVLASISSSSASAADRVGVKCRKILFSGEDEMFHNTEDVSSSFIDFVVQQEENSNNNSSRDQTSYQQNNASSSPTTSVEQQQRNNNNNNGGGATVKRKESLNDRFARRQNESSLFARKWTKKSPSHSAAVLQFNRRTGLPLSSSPAPLKRNQNSFNFDSTLSSVTAIKSAFYNNDHESGSSDSDSGLPLCKSAPASTNLLGNFEESALNGRIKPFGSVDGFTLELGASGAFCPSHVTLAVTTLFFTVSDDNAPSPYFGHCSLDSVGRKGYHTPKKGTVQATLFNPQGTVVKMFVVRYDLSDMPNGCQTFVRQRTFFMPSSATLEDALRNRSWLRYLIHLRFATSRSGKLYLHTDIRMLFSRKSELDAYNIDYAGSTTTNVETYELRSFTEMPKNPKFSPRKLNGRQEREKEMHV